MIDAIFNMSGTGVLMVVIGIVLLTWETLAFVFKKRRALLSTWFQKLGFRAPAAMLVVGMFLGHFWMYFPPDVDGEQVVCPKCRETLTLCVDPDRHELTAELATPKAE